ncbi:MAG TPA: hypothetical protein VM639_20845 [Dongiaceae bacterium]|nr:hypothetical protein [Dongiaceae bacterium]
MILVLAVGLASICLHQLGDPTSRASAWFSEEVVDRCVAAGQHGQETESSEAPNDNVVDLCRCSTDDLREDLADTGLGGLMHMVFVEGVSAKFQRVMDACQATPSAP